MSDRFAVESDRRIVGLAVRAPGGFKFFSSEPRFFALEGRIFPRFRALARSVARIAGKPRGASLEALPGQMPLPALSR